MLSLDDARWKTYKGGYHDPYDASVPLRELLKNGASDALWEELWEELHHQGDVDSASYAAVPCLLEYARHSTRLDWNVFGLVFAIEWQRPRNSSMPAEIEDDYLQAIANLPELIGSHPDQEWDDMLTRCAVACTALVRGQRLLAKTYFELSTEDAQQWLEENTGDELS